MLVRVGRTDADIRVARVADRQEHVGDLDSLVRALIALQPVGIQLEVQVAQQRPQLRQGALDKRFERGLAVEPLLGHEHLADDFAELPVVSHSEHR